MAIDWDAGKILAVSSGYWRGCAIQAAVRLKFFSFISEKKHDAASIAQAAGTEVRATGLLLDAMSAMGLLEKSHVEYYNTDFSEKFLVKDSPAYVGHAILHHHHILDGWVQLDKAVTTGKKVEKRSYGVAIERESFLMGMFNVASGQAPRIAEKFPLAGKRKLLDLGGGPGTYSIHFCLENKNLGAVIYDKPTTRSFAEKTIERYELADRITFMGGDFNVGEIPGGPYDVAWISHILHSSSYAQCEALIEKVAAQLVPGGLMLIHDFILNDDKDGPEFPALFSLNMLVGTENGRAYSELEITSLMDSCGLVKLTRHNLQLSNESSILSGVKV
jgi:hypothetical protein